MAARKAAISFGLVYIPVELYTAVEDNTISFHQITRSTGSRVRYQKVAEDTGKVVRDSDIVKGYQYKPDEYVVVTDDELEAIKTEEDRNVTIVQFVEGCSIDPVYFNKPFNVLPQKGGEKSFNLLLRAMKEERKIAVGSTVMGSTETMVALMPAGNGMLLQTLWYEEEIRELPKALPETAVSNAEVDMARALIKTMERPFTPEQFKDGFREKLEGLIRNKIDGHGKPQTGERASGGVLDLVDALKQSLMTAVDEPGKSAAASGKERKKSSAKKTGLVKETV